MNKEAFSDIHIESTCSGSLAEFEYLGRRFSVTRAAGMSNLYLIHVSDESCVDINWTIGLAIWTCTRNEFAISTDGVTNIPYEVLLPNLRNANTNYIKIINKRN